MKLKTLLFAFLLLQTLSPAQINPQVYYTFDQSNPLTPQIGSTNLTGGGTYSIAAGQVGNCILQNNVTSTLMTGQSVPVTTQITVELAFKADYLFSDNRDQQLFTIGTTSAKFIYPYIRFNTSAVIGGVTTSDNFEIRMDGVGPKSWKYYIQGWHHLVFTYNAGTGRKTIYVDGAAPAGFTKSVTAGGTIAPGANANLTLSSNTPYIKGAQYLDEIAVYNAEISAAQVCGDYNRFISGNHYAFAAGSGCAAVAVTAPLDVTEFPLGYTLGSINSSGVTRTALTQLKNYVLPRWPEAKDAPWNGNWLQLNYMAGQYQPGVNNRQVVDTGAALNIELTTNWNYAFLINTNFISYTDYDDTTRFPGKMVAISNRNKQWPTFITSFWNQLNPTSATIPGGRIKGYIVSQDNPANHYLRNSAGQYLNAGGSVTTGLKFLSPAMPLDSIKKDARAYKILFNALAAEMDDTLDMISENDEVLPMLQSVAMGQDPAVIAAMSTAGISTAREFLGYAHWKFNKLWQDSVRSIPEFASVKFSEYQIDGEDSTGGVQYSHIYFGQRKKINDDPLFGNTSTVDIYPRYPWNWYNNVGAYRGILPLINGRNTEMQQGVEYYTPFVSPGYAENEEQNIRPAQWLGYMKVMSMLGARRFYISYFNTNADYNPPNPPPFTPKGYAWDAVMPVYAQAATDWVMSNSTSTDTLLSGDMPCSYVTEYGHGFRYYSGSPEIVTVARKVTTGTDTIQYNIGTSLQRMSNMIQPAVDTALFTIEGRTFRLETRRQGSVYTVDLNKDTAVIVQWDKWHEATHPDRWTKDMYIEAEHDTEYVSANQDIRTFPRYASAGSSFNFTNFTTYISYLDSANYTRDTLDYNFTLRSDTTLYLWVRMRSAQANKNSGFSARMDNGTAFTQNLVLDTAWKWYRIDIADDTMYWTGVTAGSHTIKLRASSAFSEIDQFLLTPNASTSLPEGVPGQANPCFVSNPPVISPSGPVTQCGGTVTLTSTAAVSYLWNTGATTQSIVVSASGNYLVTAVSGAGCTETSTPVTVTIRVPATASISPSGTTTTCSGSQVFTASAGSSWLWSTGATTQSITRTTSGTFTVTVTNSAGCTAVSSPATAVIYTATTPTITPSGPVVVCTGTPTLLSASTGNAYLWSNGSTSQSISPTVTGLYSVRVTDANGCTATSAATSVVYQPSPNITLTGGTSSACTGSTVTLTAAGASTYLWNTGATTASISVTTAGTYSVNALSVNGCSDSDSTTVAFVSCDCVAPSSVTISRINPYNAKATWTAVTGSIGYEVTATDMSSSGSSVKVWRSTTNEIRLQKLRPSRRYKVEVKTLCNTSVFSEARTVYFTTLASPL